MAEETRRRGRPPKDQAEVKRHPLGVRTTKALKDKLEAAAASTGRSVAQEVEARLEASFSRGEKHISIPLDLAAVMMRMAEDRTGQRWNEDLATWVAVKKAIDFMLSANRPRAPQQAEMIEAETMFEEELDRWREVPHVGPILEGASPLDAEAYAAAKQRLEEARTKLRDAAAPARAMYLAGEDIAEGIADLFRLRPRED